MDAIRHLWGILLETQASWLALKEKPRAWLPLLVVVAIGVVTMYMYYSTVDIDWLVQQMLANNDSLTDEQRQQSAQFMTRNAMMYGSMGGMAVMVPVIAAILALYYFLVAKVMGIDINYGRWFAFVNWANIPTALSFIVGIVLILISSDTQISTDVMAATSVNALITNLPIGHKWGSFAQTVSLITVWQIFISIVGFSAWTGRSKASATVVALVPSVLMFGVWALFLI